MTKFTELVEPRGKNGPLFNLVTAWIGNDTAIDKWAKEKKSAQMLGIEADGQQDRILGTSSFIDTIKEKLGIVNDYEYKNIGEYNPRGNLKPEYVDEYNQVVESQKDAVRTQYESTDQWMKAPELNQGAKMVHCSTVKEAETLYNEAKKNFSEVGDSDVREIVKDGIRSSIKARTEISDKPGHYAVSRETGRGLRALSDRGTIRELGITRAESRGRNGPLFN